MKSAPEILIVAGELSGDAHAARIVKSLKKQIPDLKAWGFGGDHLAAEGMEIKEHIRDLSVMGIWEVLKRYGYFKKIFDGLLADIKVSKPDLVLLVDYPGFNLRLAAALKGSGIPVIQYICPQVWAWKKNRIPKMADVLDALICIFPFEPKVFEGVDLPVFYGGHPMVEETRHVVADAGWKTGTKLALVPGSRLQEIDRIFLPMLETAGLIQKLIPDVQIRVPAANENCEKRLREICQGQNHLPPIEIVSGKMRELVKGADAALVTSGTATLETALLGTPMLILYKTSFLTYEIGKRVVQVPHIGMVNLVAEREICPEFIQHDADPVAMSEALFPLLSDTEARQKMLRGLEEVRDRLVPDKGGDAVAKILLDQLKGDA
ncbi:lipid-A-disaccharide synthase [Kiritimatiellaeota bacterium B1221]|nr:lipid-A-disaccharide synthase [Kiritimatiellaeota bacterium B1221]